MKDDASRTDGYCLQQAHRYDLTRLDSHSPARTARHLTDCALARESHWSVQSGPRIVPPPWGQDSEVGSGDDRRRSRTHGFWHRLFVLLRVE